MKGTDWLSGLLEVSIQIFGSRQSFFKADLSEAVDLKRADKTASGVSAEANPKVRRFLSNGKWPDSFFIIYTSRYLRLTNC